MHAPAMLCGYWHSTHYRVAGESRPKELFTELPIVWLKPQQHRTKPETGVYECPV